MSAPSRDDLFLDPTDEAFRRDPYPHYARLLAELPVHRSPLGLMTYCRHDDCSVLLTDPRFGKDFTRALVWQGYRDAGLTPPLEALGVGSDRPVFAFTDPPDHGRLRRAVTVALTGPWWDMQADRVAAQCSAAFASPAEPEFDFVSHVAQPFVRDHLAELMGVPSSDRSEFAVLCTAVGGLLELDFGMDETVELERDESARRLRAYFRDRVANARPGATDAVGRLAEVCAAGGMTEDDAAGICLMIVIGSVEPLTGLLAAVVEHLPERWRRVVRERPEVVGGLVEEVLRLDPVVQQVPRVVLEPVELGGAALEPGEMVVAVVAAANRDPLVFPGPSRLDPARPARRHLGLGTGPHVCFGARMARAVGRAAVEATVAAGVMPAADPAGMPVSDGFMLRRRAALDVRRTPDP